MQWIRRSLAVFALVALVAGCSNDSEADAQPIATAFSGTATVDPQEKGLKGQEEVIEDQDSLNAAWAALYAGTSDAPTVPDVDFNGGHLILIQRAFTSGGHAIDPTNIQISGSGAIVTIRQTNPGKGCASTQALSYPWFMLTTTTDVESVNVDIKEVSSNNC